MVMTLCVVIRCCMKYEHYIFAILSLSLFAFVMPPELVNIVHAQDIAKEAIGQLRPVSQDAGVAEATVEGTIGEVVRFLLSISGVFFFCLMIYGGVRWMLARGEDQQIADARRTVVAAVIGLFIMISSYSISVLVTEGVLGNLQQSESLGSVEVGEGEFGEIGCCLVQIRSESDNPYRGDLVHWVNYLAVQSECMGHEAAAGTSIQSGPEWTPGVDDRQCRQLRNQK